MTAVWPERWAIGENAFLQPHHKPTQWIVFRVTDVKTPSPGAGAADTKEIDQMLQQQLSNDVFGQYMAWLEDTLGTSVNQAALFQALGTGAPDSN